MPSQEDIDNELYLLQAHRRTLAHYLQQKAILGVGAVPPAVVHGIEEARTKIRHIKATLRKWEVLVEDLPADDELKWSKSVHPARKSGRLPPPAALVVGREADLQNLKARLGIILPRNVSAQVLTAVHGLPGIGKTTITAALVHDSDVDIAFPDGLLWTSLGKEPNLLLELAEWGRVLGAEDLPLCRTTVEASTRLAALLRNKQMLLIIDDVWMPEHVVPFRVGGKKCALLITTRMPIVAEKIAPTANDVYQLGPLSDEHALELLKRLAPTVVQEHLTESLELIHDLEGLPLALQVAGHLLHIEARRGLDVVQLLTKLREGTELLKARAPLDRTDLADETTPTVEALLQTSTDFLDETTRRRFAYLGAFAPKPATFSLRAIAAVWQASDPRLTISELTDRGLLEKVGERYRMHAVLAVYAKLLFKRR